ncbi:hypothetical protein Clacol_004694 [Clathrus columnatus]|uniref:DNA mismatch repair protein S5 domain-containing protein n=1 Tax=Clathrus columnatus TaxID=1419009 RepID=A0AAV5ACU6_9AGAM|nr:hypothetical protein Clacol_004694 [Clathrus columnatus]
MELSQAQTRFYWCNAYNLVFESQPWNFFMASSSKKTLDSTRPTHSISDPSQTVSTAAIAPRPIKRLDEQLINRIAAGEIIHRPSSALKEILENALDAGSTSIRVTVKDGGLKLLQVQDNGSGIGKSSLPLLAARFATSKISSFSDLSSLQSYGFRGEALASISHVAHLSVITKVKDEGCAWKAYYTDGVLSSPKAGISLDPKPCAGNDGTTIIVEDLFYNTPLRLQAMKSASDEYSRILDVITKYAASSASSEISTPSGCTVKQNIGLLYGATVAKELSHVLISSGPTESSKGTRKRHTRKKMKGKQTGKGAKEVRDKKGKGKASYLTEADEMEVGDEDENFERGSQDDNEGSDGSEEEDEDVRWKGEVYLSGVNYHAKKMTFLLFINHRLVESSRLKKGIESVYNSLLPKGTYPFVYLSLQIDPKSVDVNVHPTKREVHFLDEEAIIRSVCDAIQEALVKDSGSRTFQYQTLLTGGIIEEETQKEKRVTPIVPKKRKSEGDETASEKEVEEIEDTTEEIQKLYSYHKVRTSAKDRTIDSMFPILNKSQVVDVNESPGLRNNISEIEESECLLTSVRNLRAEVAKGRHEGTLSWLSEILKAHVFVGVVDLNKCLSLIQHKTSLYIVNHASLAEELFYQLGLRQFGNFGEFRLDPPAPLRTLLSFAVENEDGIEKAGLQKDRVIEAIAEILITRKEMLKEYFSMVINDDDDIETIPLLLNGYTPNLDKLPLFLMRIGPEVDWQREQECFKTFLRELAYFYVPGPIIPGVDPKGKGKAKADKSQHDPLNDADDDDMDIDSDSTESEKWQIQHVIFEAMRKHFHAPKTLLEHDVVQVASLPELYKVFERC